jgi:hypothetical protein
MTPTLPETYGPAGARSLDRPPLANRDGPRLGIPPGQTLPSFVDKATKQLSIERSLEQRATTHAIATGIHRTRILLNFPAEGRAKPPR